MKKYSLLAVDLDGTLLNNQKEITLETIDAINHMISLGYYFVIVTGRPYIAIKNLIKGISKNIYLITTNGALITTKEDDLIFLKTMNEEAAKRILTIANENKATIAIWSKNELYFNKESSWQEKYENMQKIKGRLINDDFSYLNITKIIWFDDESKMDEVKNLFKGVKANFFTSQKEFLEFVDFSISKEKALDYLLNILKIKKSEVIAIGDGENDLKMLKYAGLGVAMGNADEKVKKEADLITKSNQEDGVKQIIDCYFIKGEIKNE